MLINLTLFVLVITLISCGGSIGYIIGYDSGFDAGWEEGVNDTLDFEEEQEDGHQ